ncbi:hypothetical protein B9Z19DRAFT_1191402 [Tuber borchii]|uniref:Uncharacterized protein n=1 Tax=Tuber borchii TaxID=42251 RepID=A0A2T7A009_TUBBO|nr:hypothetical protein B9Z19DRAFT_1191402 [Tuber borchii]
MPAKILTLLAPGRGQAQILYQEAFRGGRCFGEGLWLVMVGSEINQGNSTAVNSRSSSSATVMQTGVSESDRVALLILERIVTSPEVVEVHDLMKLLAETAGSEALPKPRGAQHIDSVH